MLDKSPAPCAAITMIITWFILVVIAAPRIVFQLRIYAFLNQSCCQFLYKHLHAYDIFDLAFLDQLSNETLFFLCHMKTSIACLI